MEKRKARPGDRGGGEDQKGEMVSVGLSVGKEIPHPNTTAHHMRWIEFYFLPQGEKFTYQLGRFEFNAHGESTQGADTSTVFTNPQAGVAFKTEKSGTILASSYCNIHAFGRTVRN